MGIFLAQKREKSQICIFKSCILRSKNAGEKSGRRLEDRKKAVKIKDIALAVARNVFSWIIPGLNHFFSAHFTVSSSQSCKNSEKISTQSDLTKQRNKDGIFREFIWTTGDQHTSSSSSTTNLNPQHLCPMGVPLPLNSGIIEVWVLMFYT